MIEHSHIRDPERYYDRTFSEWHQTTLPRWHTAIDVDLLPYCTMCSDALCVIEVATSWDKPTTVVKNLAARLSIEAVLVVQRDHEVLGCKVLTGPNWTRQPQSAEWLEQWLIDTRHHHYDRHHPGFWERATRHDTKRNQR